MFEDLFKNEILKKQDNLNKDTKRVTEEYLKFKENNPTMLDNTEKYIDFSNPSSVAGMQRNVILNPYGYNNPYNNPNLVSTYQNNNNPYVYNRPITYGNNSWYGNNSGYYYNNFYNLTSDYMTPNEDDIINGDYVKGKVILKNEEDNISSQSVTNFKDEYTYEDKLIGKNIKVSVVFEEKEENNNDQEDDNEEKVYEYNGIRYTIENIDIEKHEPHTPFKKFELDQDRTQLKLIAHTPLEWTEVDEEELDQLCNEISIYDKAMAHILWNIPCNIEESNLSREEYNYCKIYIRNLIQEYRSNEILNPNIDYRAKYRYRPLPETTITTDGEEIVDIETEHCYAIKTSSIFSSEFNTYVYDREREELTQYEWDLFLDRAFLELMRGIKILQGKDLMMLNNMEGELYEEENNNITNKQNELPPYNPNDPISVKLHNMKESESSYNNHKDFFKHVLRHKYNEVEFDNWWYGTQTNAQYVNSIKDPIAYRNSQDKIWRERMTEQNINALNNTVPLNDQYISEYFNQNALKEIEKYTKGSITNDMTAADFLDNLDYLNNRIHEMNVEENIKRYNNSLVYNAYNNNFVNRNMFNHMLYEFHNNDNPNYVSPYGLTIDPRMGVPSVLHDYTEESEENYRQRYQRFMNACSKGIEFPLSQAGILK